MMNDFLRRTWAEIDLDVLTENYRAIRGAVPKESMMCCVVKADAYGHGAPTVARLYQQLGADWFAVSNLEEAVQLRRSGIRRPILILGYTPPEMAGVLMQEDIAQSVLSLEYARALSEQAQKAHGRVRCHIKVDTGMSRIGFFYQKQGRDDHSLIEIEEACRLEGLNPEGIFTHFAVADEAQAGEAYTEQQYGCFRAAIAYCEAKGIHFSICHCCNSGAILDYPQMALSMVRPGIIQYGLLPSGQMRHPIPLRPAMSLRSVISHVKTIVPGTTVSYGRTFQADKAMTLATVPIGYADGYPRRLSGQEDVLVNGKRAPIVGRVCMDQMMIDVTGIDDVHPGQTVTLFGEDHGTFLSVEELSQKADTISYETICLIGKRVPRIYLRDGKPITQMNYFDTQSWIE